MTKGYMNWSMGCGRDAKVDINKLGAESMTTESGNGSRLWSLSSLNLRLLMSYIYRAPILDVSRSHTTTHHSR
jgi:hypothetical protein